MMRSLFAGVSGLRTTQVRMDVIGNNVANASTVAFKSGRVTFKEGFAQLVAGASRPPGDQGGINPIQVGLGTQVGSVDTLFTQGNIESTGLATDLAIQGDSFFVVRKGNQSFFTRSGNFQIDADGKMVSPTNGFVVQGRMYKDGVLQDGIQDIQLPFGQKVAARSTSAVKLAGNLDASAPVFDSDDPSSKNNDGFTVDTRGLAKNAKSWAESSITVFDSLGDKHDLKIQFWKTAAEPAAWDYQIIDPFGAAQANGEPAVLGGDGTGTLTFGDDGVLTSASILNVTLSPPGAQDLTIKIDLGDGINGLTQYAGVSSPVLRDQDGYAAGTLQNFSIDRSGLITGYFTNGVTSPLGQVALADFNNPSGLLRIGDNMYQESANSGGPVVGFALEGSQSQLTSGALEMSNVDLSQEFTNMIVTQRGFQANGRVITSSDELLQEVVNLKR